MADPAALASLHDVELLYPRYCLQPLLAVAFMPKAVGMPYAYHLALTYPVASPSSLCMLLSNPSDMVQNVRSGEISCWSTCTP